MLYLVHIILTIAAQWAKCSSLKRNVLPDELTACQNKLPATCGRLSQSYYRFYLPAFPRERCLRWLQRELLLAARVVLELPEFRTLGFYQQVQVLCVIELEGLSRGLELWGRYRWVA